MASESEVVLDIGIGFLAGRVRRVIFAGGCDSLGDVSKGVPSLDSLITDSLFPLSRDISFGLALASGVGNDRHRIS